MVWPVIHIITVPTARKIDTNVDGKNVIKSAWIANVIRAFCTSAFPPINFLVLLYKANALYTIMIVQYKFEIACKH